VTAVGKNHGKSYDGKCEERDQCWLRVDDDCKARVWYRHRCSYKRSQKWVNSKPGPNWSEPAGLYHQTSDKDWNCQAKVQKVYSAEVHHHDHHKKPEHHYKKDEKKGSVGSDGKIKPAKGKADSDFCKLAKMSADCDKREGCKWHGGDMKKTPPTYGWCDVDFYAQKHAHTHKDHHHEKKHDYHDYGKKYHKLVKQTNGGGWKFLAKKGN